MLSGLSCNSWLFIPLCVNQKWNDGMTCSHSVSTLTHREPKASPFRSNLTLDSICFNITVWRRGRQGKEQTCNLIPLFFVFIHSASWQIKLNESREGRETNDREWMQRQRQNNEVTVRSAQGSVLEECASFILLMNSMSWFIVSNLAEKCVSSANEVLTPCVCAMLHWLFNQ